NRDESGLMCTVSLLALPRGGYLLAANRDEHVTRGVARPPERAQAGGNSFVAPRDSDAGGTWIAVDRDGRTLCLLNGDRAGSTFEPPSPPPPSPVIPPPAATDLPSRGRLVVDLMKDPRPAAVVEALRELHRLGALNYRPFKLVAVA